MTPEVALSPSDGMSLVPPDVASFPAPPENGDVSQGSVTYDQRDSSDGDIAEAPQTFQQTEIGAPKPQRRPDYVGREYRAPIPGTTEEIVYRQYYIPYCLSVGVKPAPFLRWLDLSRIIDRSSVEILDWVAPGRLDPNRTQPSWKDDD